MMEENIFEIASQMKIRFSYKGELSPEDLWDLSLKELDIVYKSLASERRNSDEDSLMGGTTKEDKVLALKIDIVRHIFNTKKDDEARRKENAQRKQQKEYLLGILQQKENEELLSKSPEEIRRMIEEL